MRRAVVAFLLAVVVASSGCSEFASDSDLQHLEHEVKDHVTEEVDEASSPVTKYRLQQIDVYATCVSPGEEDSFTRNVTYLHPEVFEREEGLQTFNSGKTIVLNGISDVDSYIHCPDAQRLDEISVDTVEFNESVYSSGSLVATGNKTCDLYASVQAEDRGYQLEHELRELAHDIYSECLLIESDIEFDGGDTW